MQEDVFKECLKKLHYVQEDLLLCLMLNMDQGVKAEDLFRTSEFKKILQSNLMLMAGFEEGTEDRLQKRNNHMVYDTTELMVAQIPTRALVSLSLTRIEKATGNRMNLVEIHREYGVDPDARRSSCDEEASASRQAQARPTVPKVFQVSISKIKS